MPQTNPASFAAGEFASQNHMVLSRFLRRCTRSSGLIGAALLSENRISRKRAVDLVMQMMAIPGKSGHERLIAEFIQSQLIAAGLPSSAMSVDNTHKAGPRGGEVGNLVVKLPGTFRGPRRLLMGHIDTVPLCVGSRPVKQGGFIHSKDPQTALGGDNRAGAAVVLNAALEILTRQLPHPPLTLFWPVQEEVGLLGVRYARLSKLGRPNLCFNWDGGIPYAATIGATGAYTLRIHIAGIASHAGVHPDQGVSAIAIAGLAIADLTRNGWHGLIVKGKHAGTSNIGFVHGGEATNVVTPAVSLHAECRSHDPQFRRRIADEFRTAFEKAAESVRDVSGRCGSVQFNAELEYESFQLDASEPCVSTALAAIRHAGLEPETRISNGGLDANWMTAHGFPTVTMGCGQQNAHTVDECLHVDSFLHACQIGLTLATGEV